MSSIILHVCVANQIMKDLNLSYDYIKGSIMPDIKKISGISRNITHYITDYIDGVMEVPNLEKFIKENYGVMNNEEVLGYYSHLIEDKIWFNKYVVNYVKADEKDNSKIRFLNNNEVYNMQEYRNKIYRDFNILDNYLIKKYIPNIQEIKEKILIEVENKKLQKIIDNSIKLNDDFTDEKTFFFNKEDANSYISDCVDVVKNELEKYIK